MGVRPNFDPSRVLLFKNQIVQCFQKSKIYLLTLKNSFERLPHISVGYRIQSSTDLVEMYLNL